MSNVNQCHRTLECKYNPLADDEEAEPLLDTYYIGPSRPTDAYLRTAYPYRYIGVGFPYIGARKGVAWDPEDPLNSQRGIRIHRALIAPVRNFVSTLDYFASRLDVDGYGRIDWIANLGTYPDVRRPRPSYHWAYAGFDITHVHWTGGNVCKPYSAAGEVKDAATGEWKPTTHRRLVAVEACLRKWFGYVLNRRIENHDNHFHADLGSIPPHPRTGAKQRFRDPDACRCSPALRVTRTERLGSNRPFRTCNYFIQDCISAFTDVRVEYDGVWGPTTELGYLTLMSDLGMEHLDPIHKLTEFQLFLNYIIIHGLSDQRAGAYRYGSAS